MGLGEELLDDYAFEITEARDRYYDSIDREYEFYENLKRGIWTNTYGDKVDLRKIDDTYFNNIINYCKKNNCELKNPLILLGYSLNTNLYGDL